MYVWQLIEKLEAIEDKNMKVYGSFTNSSCDSVYPSSLVDVEVEEIRICGQYEDVVMLGNCKE